ncbi:cysteinyl-tRNA synthetase [Methanococcus voltae PS]|uniref:Cysteine--tRNA ligase n=1 Tax=Methanococcus voltae PS TaxID=523842 RepID=A0ABT2EYQ3_METVO|nr:cysteine--tRNA ligase [Methanococcus voltae]MCS3922854.1 cysteinyl-tRNA synthetase [Methanococcus voltae PS]
MIHRESQNSDSNNRVLSEKGYFITVYNSLTNTMEKFIPLDKKAIKMYICGPTVYDSSHLGHGRTYVSFDVIKRYLEHKGYNVYLVINFTDIDDKIINKAKNLKMDCKNISEENIDSFLIDMLSLGVEPANVYPKVTQSISEIIDFIGVLMKKDYAYKTTDGIYFNVRKFREYGRLSNIKIDKLKSKAKDNKELENKDNKEREKEISNATSEKLNMEDFALWKFNEPVFEGDICVEPAWDSPWGKGRPGWHIECSVMSAKYFGECFDIHGGGKDLAFPHHENEIAQSDSYFEAPCVKYWMHTGFVRVNGEKMSKSLGNFVTIKDMLQKYNKDTLRLFFIQRHYRSPLDYSDESLTHVKNTLDKFENSIKKLIYYSKDSEVKNKLSITDVEFMNILYSCRNKFYDAMDDDFNTVEAIKVLNTLITATNKYMAELENLKNSNANTSIIIQALEFYRDVGEVFGIFGDLKIDCYLNCLKRYGYEEEVKESSACIDKIAKAEFSFASAGKVDDLMKLVIELREDLRDNKNYEMADKIRDKLEELDIILEDNPKGTRWVIK